MSDRLHDAMTPESIQADVTTVREQILCLASNNRLVGITGTNFSGRSRALAACVANSSTGLMLPPETYNTLSGLALTVRDELLLHGRADPSLTEDFLRTSELDRLADRNPYTLSGGEQVCLALLSSVIRAPSLLAIDTVLEQLAPTLRCQTLMWLIKLSRSSANATILADNRTSVLNELLPTSFGVRLGPPSDAPLDIHKLSALPIQELAEVTAQDLRIADLSFGYEKSMLVLDKACIDLTGGRVYVLEGANGAGKSTFAKLLVGALRPLRGSIMIDKLGYVPWRYPGKYISYHFQNPDVQLFENTVEDELRKATLQSGKEVWRIFAAALGVSQLLHEHPLDLPFVVRKRVAIAAALTRLTPWVILDEPTIGQDNMSVDALVAIFACLARKGVGIIVISHVESLWAQLGATRIRLVGGSFEEVVEHA